MHPTDGEILAALDGWGDAETIDGLELHLAGCDACSTRQAELGRERSFATELLGALQTSVPERHVEAILRRSRRRRNGRRRVIAAAAALFVATAAAATMRSGGVHGILERIQGVHGPVQPARPSGVRESETATGIAVEPEGTMTIEFAATQLNGDIRVELSADPRVTVTAPMPVPYTVQSERIRLENRGSSVSYRVMLPTDLRRATITVGGRIVFSKRGTEVVTRAVRVGDSFRLPLGASR
jgi:hypothetical protein